MISREEIREQIAGPVASIRTLFRRDGSIDFDGLGRYVDFVIEAGAKTLILTYGDSLFSVLTDREVGELTKAVGERVRRRALFVAADRSWWTGESVRFARCAREVGADLLMVLPPDWAHSCTTQTFVEHYAAIAREMPVMMVTGVFASRGVAQGVEIVRAVLEQVDGVVAIKDDFCGEFARKMCRLAKGRAATFSGGQKQNHLDALPYGCDGYLSTFITFKPNVTHEYWRAIQSSDLRRATAIIERYDVPFFDFILSLPGGFDAGMHATYELFGLGERWRRPPYHSLSDAELERLAGFFRALKLL